MEKAKLQLEVSEEAKRNLKIHAVLLDTSMSEAINDILTTYLPLIRSHQSAKVEEAPSRKQQAREA